MYFLWPNIADMKKLITIVFVTTSCFSVYAQQKNSPERDGVFEFLQMKQSSPVLGARSSPGFATISSSIGMPATSYWEGRSYTSYSQNGRLSSTYSFDVQGQLRETRTSLLIKKSGVFSNWRLQFAPQQNHKALFVYKIQ